VLIASVAESPAATEPTVHVPLPDAQLPWLAECETGDRPAGTAAATPTEVARFLPRFRTTTRHVTGPPSAGAGSLGAIAVSRSALPAAAGLVVTTRWGRSEDVPHSRLAKRVCAPTVRGISMTPQSGFTPLTHCCTRPVTSTETLPAVAGVNVPRGLPDS
jgi:hypothetical protein